MIQTGLGGLDYLLGGGLPAGVVEVWGEESVGKTALAAHVLRMAHAEGRAGLLLTPAIPDTRRLLGITGETTVVALVATWQQVNTIVTTACGLPGTVVVVDNSAQLETDAVRALGLTDDGAALANKLEKQVEISDMRRHLVDTGGTAVLISDARAELGTRRLRSSLNVSWGNIIDCKIRLQQVEAESRYGELHHKRIRVILERHKRLPPGSSCDLLLYPEGFDRYVELLRFYESTYQATRRGNYWYLANNSRVGPGLDQARKQLKEKHEAGNG